MKIIKNNIILIFILIIAVLLRTISLGSVPKALHADEASFLLNSVSLQKTLKDEDGRFMPLYLESLTDPKPALFSYLQIPAISLFGVSTFSSRLPSAILGVLSILLAYKIFAILGKRKHALLASFLLSISPWHIILSRSTQEVILSLAFSLLSILIFLKLQASKKLNIYSLLFFTLASFLAMYSYHSAKIFLPSLILLWSFRHCWQKQNIADLKKSALLFGLLLLAFLSLIVSSGSGARFQAVGFLSNVEPQLILEEQIREATPFTAHIVLRALFNKLSFYGLSISKTYLQHFSFSFLFFEGGFPLRYKIPLHGLFYHINIISIFAGIYIFIKNKSFSKQHFYLFTWLLLSPLAAALTFIESPSMIRSAMMLFPMLYFAAAFLIFIWERRNKYLRYALSSFLALAYIWGIIFFIHQFFTMQAIFRPHYRNRPYELISEKLRQHVANYEKIVITNDLRPLYAYLALDDLIPISDLQNNPLSRLNNDDYQLAEFSINRGVCELSGDGKNTLYVAENRCYDPGSHILIESIAYDDGLKVYSIFEKK